MNSIRVAIYWIIGSERVHRILRAHGAKKDKKNDNKGDFFHNDVVLTVDNARRE
ncbi:MAG: hypothetical protein IKN11_07450 [Bacteroidales bacterium]|nr:hypothetical protein [Bacteroidales bacterium]